VKRSSADDRKKTDAEDPESGQHLHRSSAANQQDQPIDKKGHDPDVDQIGRPKVALQLR